VLNGGSCSLIFECFIFVWRDDLLNLHSS